MEAITTPKTRSASSLIAEEVVNRDGETVGFLHETILEVETGHVPYAILYCSDVSQGEERLVIVPWNALELDAPNRRLILDVDLDRLASAPGFDEDNWPDLSDRFWGQSVFDFYGTAPHWEEGAASDDP